MLESEVKYLGIHYNRYIIGVCTVHLRTLEYRVIEWSRTSTEKYYKVVQCRY